jgi:hypothetical protein
MSKHSHFLACIDLSQKGFDQPIYAWLIEMERERGFADK